MLVGLRAYWKYPVGYVLCDKINADNLCCRIAQTSTSANAHDLKVSAVICDGTTTNFSALKSLVASLAIHWIPLSLLWKMNKFILPLTPHICLN